MVVHKKLINDDMLIINIVTRSQIVVNISEYQKNENEFAAKNQYCIIDNLH